jgi:hypothetical protein
MSTFDARADRSIWHDTVASDREPPPEMAFPSSGWFPPGSTAGRAADLEYAAPYAEVSWSPASAAGAPAVQRKASGAAPDDDGVHAAAERGVASPGVPLPFAREIQRSFGPDHDVSGIQAHVDDASAGACAEMGAQAFAAGDHVAFAGAPDLHTAAHEAAHVVQQAQGVNLYGGVGDAGDRYEQLADAVADRVVAGAPAAPLLGAPARLGGGPAVQLKPEEPAKKPTASEKKRQGADDQSTKLFDVDLTLVARGLHTLTPKLDKAVDEVVAWRDAMADDDATIKQETRKITDLQRQNADGSHNAAINRHSETRRIARSDRDAIDTRVSVALDTWRASITGQLKPAEQKLGLIATQLTAYGLDAQGIAHGASAIRTVLARYRELCDRMGLQVDALDQAEANLNLLFKTKGIVGERGSLFDLEHMGDDKTVSAHNLDQALDAVLAHADYVKSMGKGDDMVHPVGLMIGHMLEAVALMGQLDPSQRKKLKAKVGKVVQGIKALHQAAASRQVNDTKLQEAATSLQAEVAK